MVSSCCGLLADARTEALLAAVVGGCLAGVWWVGWLLVRAGWAALKTGALSVWGATTELVKEIQTGVT